MPVRRALLTAACLVALVAPVAAQGPAPDPPGPYALDLRAAFGRGLGVDFGAHVYIVRVGASRLGLGAAVLRLPGDIDTTLDPEATQNGVTAYAPQISFNFGAAPGWSYISAGYGRGRVGEGDWGAAINAGGGARWFLTDHAAFGFDLRYHALPDDSVFAVSAGISLR